MSLLQLVESRERGPRDPRPSMETTCSGGHCPFCADVRSGYLTLASSDTLRMSNVVDTLMDLRSHLGASVEPTQARQIAIRFIESGGPAAVLRFISELPVDWAGQTGSDIYIGLSVLLRALTTMWEVRAGVTLCVCFFFFLLLLSASPPLCPCRSFAYMACACAWCPPQESGPTISGQVLLDQLLDDEAVDRVCSLLTPDTPSATVGLVSGMVALMCAQVKTKKRAFRKFPSLSMIKLAWRCLELLPTITFDRWLRELTTASTGSHVRASISMQPNFYTCPNTQEFGMQACERTVNSLFFLLKDVAGNAMHVRERRGTPVLCAWSVVVCGTRLTCCALRAVSCTHGPVPGRPHRCMSRAPTIVESRHRAVLPVHDTRCSPWCGTRHVHDDTHTLLACSGTHIDAGAHGGKVLARHPATHAPRQACWARCHCVAVLLVVGHQIPRRGCHRLHLLVVRPLRLHIRQPNPPSRPSQVLVTVRQRVHAPCRFLDSDQRVRVVCGLPACACVCGVGWRACMPCVARTLLPCRC